VVSVDDATGNGAAGVDGHAQGVGGHIRPLGGVDRPAVHAPRPRIQDDAAVQLALTGRVLGDIGYPQLAGVGAAEVAADHAGDRDQFLEAFAAGGRGQASQSGAAHQQTDRVPDGAAVPVDQLGVHPGSTVGAAGGLMDGADQIGQPGLKPRPAVLRDIRLRALGAHIR
jgi:hypothetical protein